MKMDRIRKSKLLVGLVSALLLFGLTSVAVSLPAPAPMLMLARTQVPPTIMSSVGLVDDNQIEGAIVHFEDFAITTDADTTSAIYLGGLIPWRVINESGAAATLTFYDARSVTGTALAVVDQDDVAVSTMTIGDDESQELPSALAGCTVLIIKGAVAADGFTVVAKR
jgi:hypothetical protein